MRVITLNCNGIRSADRKGFFSWYRRQKADFICLQEVRAQMEQLPLRARAPRGMQCAFHFAKKKGYSGVAIYTPHAVEETKIGIGIEEWDAEGRWAQVDVGPLSIVSLYVPSGSSGPERQERKMRFLDDLFTHLKKLRTTGREYIISADWNIAPEEIDLTNYKGNRKNSGFLPEERDWIRRGKDELGYVDAFRRVYPEERIYTWWSNRGQAYAKNVGWRLDYQIATPRIGETVQAASVYKRKRFSDHAPLIMDYDFSL